MKISFLAGGTTAESDFTLESVKHLVIAAEKCGWTPHILPTTRSVIASPEWQRKLSESDVAFPLISGLESICEALDVPYVGSPPTAAGIAADKGIFNDLLVSWGYRKTPYVRMRRNESSAEVDRRGLMYPLFIKPSRLGASFGISRVTTRHELETAIAEARSHDPEIVVETAIAGIEVEVAAISGKEIVVSEPGVVQLPSGYEWHDTESKEFATMAVPGGLSDRVIQEFKATTVDLVKRLGATGAIRFDYFLTSDDEIFVGEVNALPGHDRISNFPVLFEKSGVDRPAQLSLLVEAALFAHANNSEMKYKF